MPSRRRSKSGAHFTVMEPRVLPDWEAAHVFLEVARSKSFRAASDKLHQSVNALRRRVDEMEARMGFALLLRRANGVALTEEGGKVYQAALAMEMASFDLLKAHGDTGTEGEVTIAVTEGLGSFWLTTKMPEFRRAHPGVLLNVIGSTLAADITRLEADIVVRLDRPKSSELKISKLGRLHVMFYASRSYLLEHGHPSSLDDLAAGHSIIVQSDAKEKWLGAEKHLLPGGVPPGLLKIRTNIGTANGLAVASGAGIGVLPTYVEAIPADLGLVALDLVPAYPIDIWVTYHADAKKIPRVRKAIDWLSEAFDPRRHPWFRDEFIHPRKFNRSQKDGSAVMTRRSKQEEG